MKLLLFVKTCCEWLTSPLQYKALPSKVFLGIFHWPYSSTADKAGLKGPFSKLINYAKDDTYIIVTVISTSLVDIEYSQSTIPSVHPSISRAMNKTLVSSTSW